MKIELAIAKPVFLFQVYLQKYREAMKGDKQPGDPEFESLPDEVLGRKNENCRKLSRVKKERYHQTPSFDDIIVEFH